MGNKIITEKDFWKCSCGAVPAQFQSIQKSTKKQSGEKFITVKDTATSSWIDFGCTRMMLIMAIIAAAVVVIAAMTVATGGAALIALGALAGLAGAAWGAVIGTMLCGQLAAKARKWVGSKNNYIIQGVETITGNQTMTCPVGGVVTFAPEIKNWSQAIALGASNYISGLMEGMMAGAAIGMGGAALSGGAGAFASGGMRGVGQAAWQFARSAPMNVIRNIGATFGYAGAGASTTTVVTTATTAVGLRGVTATQAGLAHYGNTGESGWGAAGRGVFGMEEGMYHSGSNILSGNASWQDVAGMALLLSPVHKAPEELKGNNGEPVRDGETARDGEQPKDGEQQKADEETVKDANTAREESAKKEGEGEAYEARLGDRRISDDLYSELRDQTPTQEIRDMVNEGIQLPMPDPVLPGLEITKRLHADHIVPMDRITRMEGFDQLTLSQKLEVLNNPDNFVGLSPSANTSKGPKTFSEWTQHISRGIDVEPSFRAEMIRREQILEGQLQKQIDDFLSLNNG
ncbi:hypothetical protein [Pedobacter frigidisoli]|uniref:hypothetical protein n=1 Tax=Pedobacter frigidisoli TaxID=2530455 RepID=UPI00292EEA31|nr:hypothetical protein [Pedobacter frigidisoli]